MNIFLAPRANETSYKNFLSTIDDGVDYSVVEPFLENEGKQKLSSLKKVFAWGNKESKESSWKKMREGDYVLFYKGRDKGEREGKFVYAGKLLYKQKSRDLGLALWPPKKGEEPWVCVFFLSDLAPIYLPVSDITDAADYSRNFIVQGFMPLNNAGVNNLKKKYGNLDAFIKNYKADGIDENESDLESASSITAHSEAELLLLKSGQLLGYDTYTPSLDRTKEAYGEKLADYCSLDSVPSRFLGDSDKIAGQIDVIWFEEDIPKHAFEVEHTTKFNSGFTRLVQLQPLQTRLNIVSSNKNYPLFEKFINSAAFYRYKDDFFFRNYKQVESFFKSVSEFEKIRQVFMA